LKLVRSACLCLAAGLLAARAGRAGDAPAPAAEGTEPGSPLATRSLWDPRLREIVAQYERDALRLGANRSDELRAFYWPKFEPAGPRDRDLRQLFGKANVVITWRREGEGEASATRTTSREREELRSDVDPANVKGAAFFREVGALFREAVVPASFERYDGQRGTLSATASRTFATFAPLERWPASAAAPAGAHTVVVFGSNRAPTRFEEYDSLGRLIETREYTHARVGEATAVQSYTVTPSTANPAADRRTIRLFYGEPVEGDQFPERVEYAFTKTGLGLTTVRFVRRALERGPF